MRPTSVISRGSDSGDCSFAASRPSIAFEPGQDGVFGAGDGDLARWIGGDDRGPAPRQLHLIEGRQPRDEDIHIVFGCVVDQAETCRGAQWRPRSSDGLHRSRRKAPRQMAATCSGRMSAMMLASKRGAGDPMVEVSQRTFDRIGDAQALQHVGDSSATRVDSDGMASAPGQAGSTDGTGANTLAHVRVEASDDGQYACSLSTGAAFDCVAPDQMAKSTCRMMSGAKCEIMAASRPCLKYR